MDVMTLAQFMAAAEAYEFFYHKLALPFYTNEGDPFSKAQLAVMDNALAGPAKSGFAPVYMNKLAAKMRTMVARTAHENDHFSARQVQQVTHTVHGILKNGVTDSAKIERLLAKFGEAPGPSSSTTLRYSVPVAMLPAAEDQTWMGRANPARPKGKRPVQNLPGALHPL